MKFDQIREIYNKDYDRGILNHAVRGWFYLNRGLDLINQFKYLLAGIFAVYYTLQLSNVWWLVIIFGASIPLLLISGYYWTHYMAKRLEYNSIFFASFWGRYNVDLNENTADNTAKTVKLLEELLQEIKNKGKI